MLNKAVIKTQKSLKHRYLKLMQGKLLLVNIACMYIQFIMNIDS